ncbi:hypothetical protein SADUNF_Sadunf11G0101400 [Salix dunnii]|uniref:Phospholipid/glycerol acyltransferase domain-containing protein n=1 Tax=Salix dunnii TaxID=1413687 RepID=A0A835JP37_9ROSI|nr:hypothetical protein SADUNF_Sadunf11G0101400 [Salix dunnii]
MVLVASFHFLGNQTESYWVWDNTGGGSYMRNRRLESFLDTNSTANGKQTPKILVREEVVKCSKSDVYIDDDGWISALISCVRIVVCFLSMMVTTFVWSLILFLLLPWPYERIRQGNIYGHVTGRMLAPTNYNLVVTPFGFGQTNKFRIVELIYNARRTCCGRLNEMALDLVEGNMWILGNPIRIHGSEFSNERAIYICNHASPIDIFLMMWLTPTGTVGIAKKEIIWYPLFGQLYVLANHLRIDRTNPAAAIQSMKEVAHAVVKNNLSLIIFPEGTRSKDGRLQPFKKTRLPIVPMIFTGTHHAWRKGGLHVRPAPITVRYLRPIKTDDWTEDKVNDYIRLLHDIYVENLPEAQRPLHYKIL